MYLTPLHNFLTQEEYNMEIDMNNLKDKTHLKRLAKKFLEERVEIKRMQEDNFGANEYGEEMNQEPQYTFEIVFDRIQNIEGSAMMSSNDDMNGSY